MYVRFRNNNSRQNIYAKSTNFEKLEMLKNNKEYIAYYKLAYQLGLISIEEATTLRHREIQKHRQIAMNNATKADNKEELYRKLLLG